MTDTPFIFQNFAMFLKLNVATDPFGQGGFINASMANLALELL